MKKLYLFFLLAFIFVGKSNLSAQVTVTATSGTLTGTYTTLKLAFDAINLGTHKGDIIIDISANTTEGAIPATLNSGDADPTAYSSILIQPSVDAVSISGNPGAGFGVIQFNGADNVVISGDNPNTAGYNRDLTINNTSTASVTASSVIRIATRPTAASSADNNFILNCILNGNVTSGNGSGTTLSSSSANISFGIYCGGNAGVSSGVAPVAITAASPEAALTATTINNLVIDNNIINQCGRAIEFNGAVASVSSSLTITNNIIGAAGALGTYPYTTPATTVYCKGIWIAGTDAVYINSNTIRNILSYLSTTISGIELVSAIGSGAIDISSNTLTGVVNNGTANDAFGILMSSVSSKFSITANIISVVENNATLAVAGIKIATSGGQAKVNQNNISGIFARNVGGYGASGINLFTAASGAEISNNFIYNLMNFGSASFNNTDNVAGIIIGSGTGHKIYHNSINLYGNNAGPGSNLMSCLHVTSSAITSLDIRNNIFSNTVTSGSATDANICLYLPFAASAGMGYTINNNAYFTGSTAGKHGIAHINSTSYSAANILDVANFNALSTAPAANFRNYSSALGVTSNDFASFGSTAAAPFTSSTDLHIPAATATRLESGAVPVGISVDYDNAARSGTAPDIGADEFAGTPQDLTPPLITFTPLTGTCTIGNRTLTATITDASGVPVSGAGLPVLYWKINAGAYVAVTGVSGGGGIYNFTFGAGAVAPDVVSYYIVAQDNAGTPNVISQSSIGAGGFTANPPSALTAPTPDSYGVQNNLLPGTYTVGLSGVYTTLTAAVNSYNTSCLSGAVIFNLIDASYPAETFPIVIGNAEASSTNTLKIKPNATTAITGASPVALIKLNGADYITIDGSNSGGTSQDLTITNTDATTTSAVIWVGSASASNGATHNAVKNCVISGNATTTTYGGIVSSGGTTIGGTAEAANTDNTYQNNVITTCYRGIMVNGPSGREANTIITENKIGSATLGNKIGFIGILISNQTNISVNINTIFGITNGNSSNTNLPAGITVRGSISGGNIFSNVISDVRNTNTAQYSAHGITLQSTSAATGLNIYNNFIYDIAGDGEDANIWDNGHGIGILTGGGYNIYYNSINLNTNQNNPGNSAAIFIDNRGSAGTTPVSLNIKNNIFSNQQTAGVRYGIYSSAPASSFAVINYNDYYSTGTNLGFLAGARNNLAGWQSATSQDGNSISVNPVFLSGTNLHLKTTSPSSTLNGQGNPVAGITTDIDGDVRNATTPDMGADEFTPDPCGGVITGGTITASQTTVCVSAGVVFASTGFSTGTSMTYQWESSPDNAAWSPIGGETNPSGVNITVSATTYYRLTVTCTLTSTTANSNVIQVTATTPLIVSSSSGTPVCGLGTVTLTANGSSGTTVNWYANLTGGSPLTTGTNYTTPVISSTTNYYAEAVAGSANGAVGPVSPTAEGGIIGTQTISWDVGFDVIQSTRLLSVDVFPLTSGQTSTLNVYNSSNTILASIPYTTTVSGGATAQTIPINLTLTTGTGYYIYAPGGIPAGGATRNTSGAVYPYTSSAINITGNGFDQNYFMCYYNWQFSSGCASAPRTAVVATVSLPPAFTAPTASANPICAASSTNLTALDADYSIYSWSPATGLSNAAIANPVATPAATTTYTVTASNGTCATTANITITVNPIPSALSITPANPVICVGAIQSLTATGGAGDFFRERFEIFPISKFVVTGSGITENQSLTYYQEGTSAVRLTHVNNISDASPAAYELSNNLNLSLYSNPVLTFQHICALETNSTGTLDWDFGYVEYSTDGGTVWTPFPQTSYAGGSTALRNGVVCFEKHSYTDWNTQFTGTGSTPGASPGTALWKPETINLSTWQTSTQFKFRFRIKSDVSDVYYGWLLDDIKINGQASITWSPTTELFTNAAATINYTGTNNPVVYTKQTATRTYTATASFGTCSVTANVTATLVSNPATITITSAQGTSGICGADTVDLSAAITPVGLYGGTAFYDWQKNGITITGTATGGSSIGTTITVASTATLFPGMRVSVIAGSGFFAANTRIVSILNATQFTVSAAPGIALSGATVSATASGSTVTNLRYSDLVTGDVVTCVLSVGGVTCMPANPVTSNLLTFTILPTTPTSVSVVASTTTICATQSVTFTATPTNGGAAPTYEWFVNGTSQGAASASTTFTTTTLANGNIVTCRMYSNATNCPFPKAPYSSGITMTVNPSFPVSVSITSSPAPAGSTVSICNATSVTFTATPTNGGVTPTYQWFIGATPVGTNSPTYTTSTLVDLDVVTCVLTSSISSCALGNPATSNALNISVTTQPASVTIAPGTAICAGIARTYTATPVNGGATPTYQWYVNSIPVGTNSATYNYTPLNGDVVAVDMSSSLTCATPNPATVSITQTVNANPTAAITGNSTLCVGVPAVLNSNATAGSGAISTIQWRLGGSNIVGATNTVHTASVAGNYDVVVSNTNGCTVTSSVFALGAATTLMAGTYYIGRINAVNVNGNTTTLTATSTANLVVGAVLSKVSGGGTFAASTVITSIVNGTTFTVNTAPTVAMAGAAIAGLDCDDYPSFAAAIADLNTRSISAACTFNVQPGYVENLTSKMAALGNVTLNAAAATRTLTFQKNGAGANPKIVSYTGGVGTPASAAPDGIFTISGTDNVTIDGIDLEENAANTTNPSTMEYGYGLFKLAAGDGVQNATIKNCVITLNRINNATFAAPMVEGSVGILVINSTAIAATTILTPTNGGTVNTNGSNSTNKFYTNTIQNCNYGIVLSGYAATLGVGPAPTATSFLGDLSNDIGGAVAGNGNTILNFGSAGTNAAAGVRALNQWSVNISYNTLNSNNGSGTNHAGNLRGFFGEAGLSGNVTITNNTVTLKTAATAGTWTGIDNVIGSTASANTVNINNNTIQNCSFSGASSPVFLGISNTSTAATININTNTITSIGVLNAGTPGATLINNTATGATACSISNNSISSITNAALSGSIRGISIGNSTNGTFNLNTVDAISYTAATSTGSIDGIVSIGSGQANTFTNNIVRNLSVPTTGTINGIREFGGAGAKAIQNNQVYNFSTTPGGVGGATFNGILSQLGTTVDISNNQVYSLNSTGTTGGTLGTIAGIQVTSGTTVTASKNKIYTLSTTSTGPLVYGMLLSGPTSAVVQTLTASNNFIADLKAPAANLADAIRGIGVTAAFVGSTSTYNIYYNSIYLNASSTGAIFGTSGIYHAANATATIASLNLRNNIIYNTSIKSGGGLTVAFRRLAATLSNYAATSNNNLYYAGTSSASNLIYYDGTNSDLTITAFKTRVSTRDAASVSDVVNFASTTDLHLAADNNCILEGKAAVIAGFTDDIDLQARSGSTPDIGADEFTGTNPVSLTVTNPATVCSGGSIDLTSASVTTGSLGGTQLYYYSDAGGTTTLATPNNITVGGTYYIKYGKGSCYSSVTPVVVTFTASGTWLGVSTIWNSAGNWCGGIPSTATDVTIPTGLSNYPIITSGVSALANNVTIASGASITTLGTGSLDIKGALNNNGNLLNWGEIKLTGSSAQTFPGATGTITAMTRLTINNATGVTINRDLLIREAIIPTAGAVNLNNVFITLRSVVDSTARIGVVGGSFTYTGTGNFVVERYYPSRRTWRLLTAPVVTPLTGASTKTIFGSWQVGGAMGLTGNGTYMSGPSPSGVNGLDASPLNNYSLKRFNYATSAFDGIGNTKLARMSGFPAGNSSSYLTDTVGYFVFIRGDRTAANVNAFNTYGAVTTTTLRDTGNVKTGVFTFNCNPGIGANIFTLIGNPYASPVDFATIGRSNVNNKFWAWDPNLNSVGGYVTLDFASGYVPVKVPLSSTGTVAQTQYIQSSQAILVETSGGSPTVTFNETDKSAGSTNNLNIFRPGGRKPVTTLAANIYVPAQDGSKILADGVVTQFNKEFSKSIDGLDAAKFTNVNETFSIVSNNNLLSLERRPMLTENDTLFYFFGKNIAKNYRFNVFIQNFAEHNLTGFLEDSYLKNCTPVNMNGDTWVDFKVNAEAASAAKNRFRIVFKKLVQSSSINGYVVNTDIALDWKVTAQFDIIHYEIERSVNGTSFEQVGNQLNSVLSQMANAYSWLDISPTPGVYYYRVKCVGSSGAIAYTDKVKVTIVKSTPAMYVFPNPVTNSTINLQMNNMPAGKYYTTLMTEDGKAVNKAAIIHAGGTAVETINPKTILAAGSYRLEVTGPDKNNKNKVLLKIIVQTK